MLASIWELISHYFHQKFDQHCCRIRSPPSFAPQARGEAWDFYNSRTGHRPTIHSRPAGRRPARALCNKTIWSHWLHWDHCSVLAWREEGGTEAGTGRGELCESDLHKTAINSSKLPSLHLIYIGWWGSHHQDQWWWRQIANTIKG